ncbi:MAG TPA: hypothetical protein DDW52_16715 [Planctomycetaceae bacterium]|nr:hypothetical protein [Planctomycetaceae bacterium]
MTTQAAPEKFELDHRAVRHLMPHGYPFQMFDIVEEYDHAAARMVAIKNVSQNDPFLPGHFPGNPIFPGVLTIEALAQTAGCCWIVNRLINNRIHPDDFPAHVDNINDMATVLAESKIKHTHPVYPGDQIRLETKLSLSREEMCVFKAVASVNGNESSRGSLTLARIPWNAPPS